MLGSLHEDDLDQDIEKSQRKQLPWPHYELLAGQCPECLGIGITSVKYHLKYICRGESSTKFCHRCNNAVSWEDVDNHCTKYFNPVSIVQLDDDEEADKRKEEEENEKKRDTKKQYLFFGGQNITAFLEPFWGRSFTECKADLIEAHGQAFVKEFSAKISSTLRYKKCTIKKSELAAQIVPEPEPAQQLPEPEPAQRLQKTVEKKNVTFAYSVRVRNSRCAVQKLRKQDGQIHQLYVEDMKLKNELQIMKDSLAQSSQQNQVLKGQLSAQRISLAQMQMQVDSLSRQVLESRGDNDKYNVAIAENQHQWQEQSKRGDILDINFQLLHDRQEEFYQFSERILKQKPQQVVFLPKLNAAAEEVAMEAEADTEGEEIEVAEPAQELYVRSSKDVIEINLDGQACLIDSYYLRNLAASLRLN